jgi:hypothetical protein
MNPYYLTVDGMLSGTGLRDSFSGEYIDPVDLGLPEHFCNRIKCWLLRYENCHYAGFANKAECSRLDQEGISICMELQRLLPESKVEYFSHALAAKMVVPKEG